MPSDIRVVNTATLRRLMKAADVHDFNRRIDPATPLDPDGWHVLSLVLFDHSRGLATDPIHHRISVLAKTVGVDHPVSLMLDVTAIHWDSLPLTTPALAD